MLRRVGSPFIGLFLFRLVLYWQAQASSQEESPALTHGFFSVGMVSTDPLGQDSFQATDKEVG
jgi:hypothetical protein